MREREYYYIFHSIILIFIILYLLSDISYISINHFVHILIYHTVYDTYST